MASSDSSIVLPPAAGVRNAESAPGSVAPPLWKVGGGSEVVTAESAPNEVGVSESSIPPPLGTVGGSGVVDTVAGEGWVEPIFSKIELKTPSSLKILISSEAQSDWLELADMATSTSPAVPLPPVSITTELEGEGLSSLVK